MKDIIIDFILSYIIFYAIFFIIIFLRSIKFELGNYFIAIIEIVLLTIIIKYFKNNNVLDLGTLLIFGINQIIIVATYLILNQEKKNQLIYKILQKKPYNNFWISNIGDTTEFEKKEIETFIKLVREKIQINHRKNIGFFVYDDENHIVEYSLIILNNYEIKDIDLIEVDVEENCYSRGYVGKFKKKIMPIYN
ncbi:hypothetical protein ACKA01_01850 [Helcococcus kunzii]|uniref:hypothetical protein n=1 Tax=Helcococcus kunzii TaxID=40091 RepID=UPI0038A182AC